ncbi:MAG: hypothetical protein Q7R47_05785, partial [Candidatus Diapherotrites archaeon]|nr:hypothetical protein [Candidatus Diapherotrites archaeon]
TSINTEAFSQDLDVFRNYFDPVLYPFGTGVMQLRLQSKAVSLDTTVPVRVQVSGEFENGPTCLFSQVPAKTVSVKIENTGAGAALDALCDTITLETQPFSLLENDSELRTFVIRNASSTRFSVEEVQIEEFDSDFAAQVVSRPSTIPANGNAELLVRATTGTLNSTRTGTFRIKVRGAFADGGAFCSQDRITQGVSVSMQKQGVFLNPVSCTAIDIIADPVTLKGRTTVTGDVLIQNNSAQTFFIESFNMFDQSDAFLVQSTVFDSFVRTGGTAKGYYGLQAFDTASEKHGTGFAQVSGKFGNGDTCSFNAIKTGNFPVTVLPSDGRSTCPDFSVSVSPRVTVDGDNAARVSFSVYNPSDKTVFLNLAGDHLVVSPFSFSVAPHETLSSSAKVTMLSGDSSNLFYNIAGSSCNLNAHFTEVVTQNASFSALGEFVSAQTSASFVSNTTLTAQVKNLSDTPRVFTVTIAGVPAQWTAEESQVLLNPLETQTVYVDVFSNGFFTSTNGQWQLKSDGVVIDSKPVSLIAQNAGGLLGILDVNVSVIPISQNQSQVRVGIRNISPFQVSGSVAGHWPSGWTSDRDTLSFTVNPNESKMLVFTVNADATAQDGSGTLTVTTTDGRSGTFGFELKRGGTTNGFFTGFVVLFGGLFGQWWLPLLVVLLVLLVFWLVNRHYEYKYPPRIGIAPYSVAVRKVRIGNGKAPWQA